MSSFYVHDVFAHAHPLAQHDPNSMTNYGSPTICSSNITKTLALAFCHEFYGGDGKYDGGQDQGTNTNTNGDGSCKLYLE
jgi:hypothetical protein